MQLALGSNPDMAQFLAGLPPGAYVTVIDGNVIFSSPGGQILLGPGNTGFIPGLNLPPTLLPQNPGIILNPPPNFNQQLGGDTGQPGPQGGNQPPAGQQQDGCEVR